MASCDGPADIAEATHRSLVGASIASKKYECERLRAGFQNAE